MAPMSTPPTRFGTLTADVHSVDWRRVVADEPRNVSLWLLYLHRSEHPAVRHLLSALRHQLQHKTIYGPHPPQWEAYTRTRLPCLLTDIACEADMFSADPVAFKNIAYGTELLLVLQKCLNLVAIHRDEQSDFAGTEECAAGVFNKRQRFFECLWNRRDHVTSYYLPGKRTTDLSQPYAISKDDFPQSAASCIIALLHIGEYDIDEETPLTFHAAHFLLFYWTYSTQHTAFQVLQPLHKLLYHDKHNVLAFTHNFIDECPAHFPHFFLMKSCLTLRVPLTGNSAYYINNVISVLLISHPAPFVSRVASTTSELVPSLMIFCHRQLCLSHTPDDLMNYTCSMLKSLQALIQTEEGTLIEEHVLTSAGRLNLVSLLARSMIGAVQQSAPHLIEPPLFILAHLEEPINREKSFTWAYLELKRSTRRIWHDVLHTMLALPTRSAQQADMKRSVVAAWTKHGDLFGLQHGLDVRTVVTASVPSHERRYWKIPKRCFWGPCGCAWVAESPHRFRVCKGCWRVLYCNGKCQEADWRAGHRLVCQPAVEQ